jgi:DNA-binding CsgD family transcriptional regulator/tetratricopeptide (TPR) repeat protein
MLQGRTAECAALDQLVIEAQAGRSQVLVLYGEPGTGKTALLDNLAERASRCRVLRAAGVESEVELAYAGLHQLYGPLLDRLDRLPEPQATALATAFGLEAGDPPPRFLVGLAVLSLLADVAQEQPVVCIVDDAHWLDRVSAQTLAFVARRLLAERIALAFAVRQESAHDFSGLPALAVSGLGPEDARALLDAVLTGPVDDQIREQIVARTGGNPLALLQLARVKPTELAGGFGLPETQALPARIEQGFVRQLQTLPDDAQRLLLVAAAEPLGDPLLLWRAVEQLGIEPAAADYVRAQGMLAIDERVTFWHPLVRSAIYRSVPADQRRAVHMALAQATDREVDPDRRAWHLAAATPGADEQVALELEQSAHRAEGRGGVAAAAAFLQRAVALTTNPSRRAERALTAAQASFQAGAFDATLGLVATAEHSALDEFQHARTDLLRGRVAFASGRSGAAAPLLLSAGQRIAPLDPELARETYMTARFAALTAGPPAEGLLREVCEAILAIPRPGAPLRPHHMLLDGVARLTTEGLAAAAPTLRRAVRALPEMSDEEVLRWGMAHLAAAAAVWDPETLLAAASRIVQLVRDAGVLAELPLTLFSLGVATMWVGDLAGGAAIAAEADSVAEAIGSRFPPYTAMRLRSLQGREAETAAVIAPVIDQPSSAEQQSIATPAYWAAAVLYNGLARYDEATAAARQATTNTLDPSVPTWVLPELIEATARAGDAELARDALERLVKITQPCGGDFALGIEARCRALLSDGPATGELYREAIDRLARTQLRPELARAHLLHGEWLRRAGRRADARQQLRTAYEMFVAIGMEAFAERARRELLATGGSVRKRRAGGYESRDELTPQEEQIARLARDGLSNPEIGAQLFLSPRTVEWHLHNVFVKLGIDSRKGLRRALGGSAGELIPA